MSGEISSRAAASETVYKVFIVTGILPYSLVSVKSALVLGATSRGAGCQGVTSSLPNLAGLPGWVGDCGGIILSASTSRRRNL